MVVSIIRQLSQRLDPIATGVAPRLTPLEGIRAVALDVYGTMFISGSGDIGVAAAVDHGAMLIEALRACGLHAAPRVGDEGVELLRRQIESFHERRWAEGVAHPEVDIRAIWRQVLEAMNQRGLIHCLPMQSQVERLAVEYECRVNPVWPMPGLRDTLETLAARGMSLAIISNSQFHTPLLFDALLHRSCAELGFAEHRCVWSYQLLEAKPSAHLFQRLAMHLEQVEGLRPSQVLYVGNDMLNDIWPAGRIGFRTALFAGDARSLRLRDDNPVCAAVTPDAVVTALDELPGLVGS